MSEDGSRIAIEVPYQFIRPYSIQECVQHDGEKVNVFIAVFYYLQQQDYRNYPTVTLTPIKSHKKVHNKNVTFLLYSETFHKT